MNVERRWRKAGSLDGSWRRFKNMGIASVTQQFPRPHRDLAKLWPLFPSNCQPWYHNPECESMRYWM